MPDARNLQTRTGNPADPGKDVPTGEGKPAPLELERGTSVGRYVILSKLGQGGMGVVYLAYDPELDRKIALKLLSDASVESTGSKPSDGQLRLLREAQGMAKLAHPNVVAVFDTGSFQRGVFLAMELVDGRDLRRWLGEGHHGWREVVEVFLQAGKGLAAAHAAGLVHRDFKPDNVLLGKDGRTRVMDFGLVRVDPGAASSDASSGDTLAPRPPFHAAETAEASTSTALSTLSPTPSAERPPEGVYDRDGDTPSQRAGESLLGSPLTQHGRIMGTLPYLAPEQYLGNPGDARSDQFSFAVSLYEALYGERPFKLKLGQARWKVPEPPKKSHVPARLHELLQRALSVDPTKRFTSMEALLKDLADDPSVRQRRWAIGALTLAAVVGLAVLARSQGREAICSGATEELAGVWDGARKEAVRSAFLKTGKGYAESSAERVAALLDSYATQWAQQRTEACRATRLQREQSEDVLTLRMLCLDRKRSALGALVGVLTEADGATVDGAISAASNLGSLSGCQNVEALRAPTRLPEDPRLKLDVEAVRAHLDRAEALLATGRYKDGLEVSQKANGEAGSIAYLPLRADAAYTLSEALTEVGEFRTAEQSARDALDAAVESGYGTTEASAAYLLGYLFAVEGKDTEAGHWARYGRAALAHAGKDPKLESEILSVEGLIARNEGRYEDAARSAQKAVSAAESAHNPVLLATALTNLGNSWTYLHQSDKALASLQKGLALLETTFGPAHPNLAYVFAHLGDVLYSLGRPDEAEAMHRRGVVLREKQLGPNHPMLANGLKSLGLLHFKLERLTEAEAEARRSLAILLADPGTSHPLIAGARTLLGRILVAEGSSAEGITELMEALRLRQETSSANSPEVAFVRSRIAEGWDRLGQLSRAQPLVESALAACVEPSPKAACGDIEQAAAAHFRLARDPKRALASASRAVAIVQQRDPNDPELVRPLLELGLDQLQSRSPHAAAETLERALELEPRVKIPALRTQIALALARALKQSGGDAGKVKELERQSRETWKGLPPAQASRIRTWARQTQLGWSE